LRIAIPSIAIRCARRKQRAIGPRLIDRAREAQRLKLKLKLKLELESEPLAGEENSQR